MTLCFQNLKSSIKCLSNWIGDCIESSDVLCYCDGPDVGIHQLKNKFAVNIVSKDSCGIITAKSGMVSENILTQANEMVASCIRIGELSGIVIVFYLRPRARIVPTITELDKLLETYSNLGIIIMGDVNGYHPLWSGFDRLTCNEEQCNYGRLVASVIHKHRLHNVFPVSGRNPTHRISANDSDGVSCIDIMFASNHILPFLRNIIAYWIDDCDHKCLHCSIPVNWVPSKRYLKFDRFARMARNVRHGGI